MPEQVAKMKDDARTFIKTIVNKISEQNPVSTAITLRTDVFDLKITVNKDKDKLKRKVKNLIQKPFCLELTEFISGDEPLTEYSKSLTSEVIQSREKLTDFKRDEYRLDDFFFQKLGIEDGYPSLTMILKIIFCLSHGQGSMERGFNGNNAV